MEEQKIHYTFPRDPFKLPPPSTPPTPPPQTARKCYTQDALKTNGGTLEAKQASAVTQFGKDSRTIRLHASGVTLVKCERFMWDAWERGKTTWPQLVTVGIEAGIKRVGDVGSSFDSRHAVQLTLWRHPGSNTSLITLNTISRVQKLTALAYGLTKTVGYRTCNHTRGYVHKKGAALC